MSFGGKVELTGESEYKRALSEINQLLRENKSSIEQVSTAYDKSDSSTKAVKDKTKELNTYIDTQKDKLKLLTDRYN